MIKQNYYKITRAIKERLERKLDYLNKVPLILMSAGSYINKNFFVRDESSIPFLKQKKSKRYELLLFMILMACIEALCHLQFVLVGSHRQFIPHLFARFHEIRFLHNT